MDLSIEQFITPFLKLGGDPRLHLVSLKYDRPFKSFLNFREDRALLNILNFSDASIDNKGVSHYYTEHN